ncbi:hypothetical protein GGH94_005893 [Coemansia aciculifera]|uniref:LisH domain-containing protein n=1 Tax=Coemansia aciculifera TaxID=417176 RepID=A0A9W8IKI7_9FUNG|nr:hypothetical protein GGH94_005893 [Coemansia aciculifera]
MAATTAHGDLLNAYVLDFLKKKGFQRTARLFADECRQLSSSPEAAAADGDSTRTAASPPSPDTSGTELPPLPIESSNNGFLAEWWSVFWEFFAVNSGRRSDSFAPSETMLTFVQHLGQHKSLPMQAQLPPGGRRPSLAKFSNANGKRRPSQDESTDNPPPPLLLPDAATEQSKRLRVADTAAGNRSPQSAALVAQYSLPDATDGDAYYHHQIQQMASQGASGVAAIPHGHGVNVGPSGVPIMSENYRDFLADTLKTVAGNNTANTAPPSSAAGGGGSSTDTTTIAHQEYLPTLLNGSGARTEQNSATANTHAQNSSSGSPLSQTQQRVAVSQANVAGVTVAGGRPPENPLLAQQQQQQQQQMLGNRPSAAQFASPHMVNSAAPRVVPTQRTKSYQLPPNGSGQPSAGGAPPGTMVPSFVPGNSFHAMQRLMSPPAMPLSLPTQAQALMTPVVGNAPTQGDIRRASSTSMSYGMQQPGGANAGMQQLGGMTPQLHHPQAPQQVRQHSATPGFAGNPGNGNGNGVLFTQEFVAAAAAAGMDPQTYANAMMAYARQQQIQNMSQQQQQHLTQQQMQQIGGGSIMEAGKSEAGSHAAALQQLRAQQSSVPPNEAPMQGRPPISLPTQFSGHQLMMMTKGMADPASVQQHQSQPQQRYMMPFQHQGVMPTPLMGNGAGLAPGAHSSPSTTMSAAPAKQTDAIVIPGGPGVMMGMQSPSATLPSPSAAATAAAAAAAAMKKPVPTKAKAKRAPKKTAAGGGAGAKSQAAANKASGSVAVGDRGLSPFMGAKPAMTSGGVGGNSGTTSTNASASPALAIKASGAQAFVGISQAAGNDTLLSSGRLDEGAFSSMLSQRGSKAAVLQPQAGASTGLDFDSTMNAFGSLGQSLEDMFKGHQGMDLHLHEFLDMDNSGNGGDMIDDAMLAYNISDPTSLSSIIGMSTSAAGNNNVLALNLSSLPGPGNNGNTGNGAGGNGGDPGTLLTLPVNHLT